MQSFGVFIGTVGTCRSQLPCDADESHLLTTFSHHAIVQDTHVPFNPSQYPFVLSGENRFRCRASIASCCIVQLMYTPANTCPSYKEMVFGIHTRLRVCAGCGRYTYMLRQVVKVFSCREITCEVHHPY